MTRGACFPAGWGTLVAVAAVTLARGLCPSECVQVQTRNLLSSDLTAFVSGLTQSVSPRRGGKK